VAVARARLVMDQAKIRELTTGSTGPVFLLVQSLTRAVETRARQEAPVRTGKLRRSIKAGPVTAKGTTVHGSVTAHAEHGIFVHEGTRPHVIRARKAKALRFVVDGRVVFAQSVNHPGTKPNKFMLRAVKGEAPRLGFAVE